MKMWLQTLVSFGLSVGFVCLMAYLNYQVGPIVRGPQVAGATISKERAVTAQVSPLVAEINRVRPNAPLVEDEQLNAVAKARLADMLEKQYYAHKSPDGTSFVDLLTMHNLSTTLYSCENLLMTSSDQAETAVAEWLASPGHKACMLDAGVNSIGSASAVFDAETGQKLYVTLYANM